jgi:Polysaccharide pyruvyl transferase
MKTLLAGWFSFEQMGATAGDLLVRDLAGEWMRRARVSYDVAVAPPFSDGVDWRSINPADYERVVFVCGPFGNGWPVTDFLERFRHCKLAGLNLSMLQPTDVWNPFDLLLERDSSAAARADLVFGTNERRVPVVGVVLVHPQNEYKAALHDVANAAIRRLCDTREAAIVNIDTRLDENSTGLRSPAEVETLVARMDLVLTTRLHGLVLALKNGVPALAIDPIAGGAKIVRQAQTIGWPLVFTADRLDDRELDKAFNHCLTDTARAEARACAERGAQAAKEVGGQFINWLGNARE